MALELFKEGRLRLAARARDPGRAPFVDHRDRRGAQVERQLDAAHRLVVAEAGGGAHPERGRAPVDEGDGRAGVAESGGEGVEREQQTLVQPLGGEQLRRHLEEQVVIARAGGARLRLRRGGGGSFCQTLLHDGKRKSEVGAGSRNEAASPTFSDS